MALERRMELQSLLRAILGSENVYFQPPSNLQIKYPCIVYNKDDELVRHADNSPYLRKNRYSVTVVDRDPDSNLPDKIGDLPLSTFNRHYTADNLHHHTYNVYF